MSKIECNLLKPFGARIGHFRLDDSTVSKFIELTDDILIDDSSVSNGHRLAGLLEKELSIPAHTLLEEGIYDIFSDMMNQYVKDTIASFKQHSKYEKEHIEVSTFMTEMWVNSQFENEYNPCHYHPTCTLSAVFYLKVPEFKSRKVHETSEKDNPDGNILFVNGSCGESDVYLEQSTACFTPSVGDLFIWPSRLLHGVYPFIGPGERRSVAFNGVHQVHRV